MARLALGRKKPLLAVIQAFDWTYYPELLPGKRGLRPPTEAELRCMSYCAWRGGRRGGCFTTATMMGDGKCPSIRRRGSHCSESRQRLKSASRCLKPSTRGGAIEITRTVRDLMRRWKAASSSALLRVGPGTLLVPPGDYLLTVNTTDQALTYRIGSPALTQNDLSVVGEARHAAVIDGWLEDKFGPFDVHIYGPIPKSRGQPPRPSWGRLISAGRGET